MNEQALTVYYVVQVLRHWSSLEVFGLPLKAHQAPGYVGFMPIFDSMEAAAAWRDEYQPTAEIAEIATSKGD